MTRVKGSELPPEWASKAGVRPDERVRVIIGPSRDEIARRLKAAMDRAGVESFGERRAAQIGFSLTNVNENLRYR